MCFWIAFITVLLLASAPTSHSTRTTTCWNGTAIPVSSFCDGKVDCEDQSDETYVGRGFKCKLNGNIRDCVLPQQLLHDNVADCSAGSDICFDEDEQLDTGNCFQCLDGQQLISSTQVCDGVLDCSDFSDECLCVNNGNYNPSFAPNPICDHVCHVTRESLKLGKTPSCGPCQVGEVMCTLPKTNSNTTSYLIYSQETSCISQRDVCNGVVDCQNGVDEQFCPKHFKCKDNNADSTSCDGKATCDDFSDECAADCWMKPPYCKNVVDDSFYCNITEFNNVTSFSENLTSSQACDNIINCNDGKTDESSCPAHFYCWGGSVLFLNQSQRFDMTTDCADGSDECPGTFVVSKSTSLEKQNYLISNPILQFLVWVMAVLALTGNVIVIIYTSKELWEDREVQKLGRLAKCNRTFVLNLAFADLLMGFYLLMLGVQGAMKANNYCSNDRPWRTSRMCILMGILTQVSSQTSVFLLLLMTSYRLYGTLHPFKVEESKLIGGAATATLFFWLLSVAIAFIPQSRFANDYFVAQYWYPLPFLDHDLLNKTEMETLVLNVYTFSYNSSGLELKDLKWRTMMEYMWKSSVTPIHPRWHKTKVVPIGFYNQYPTCQPFFYSNIGDTAWLYMASIVFFNFLVFAYIAIAYGVIYKASSRPCVRKSVRRRSKQWRRDNRTMQRKIFFLVLTDFLCWMPICIIMLVKLVGIQLHPIVHAVTGTILLPINSAVNPIVYSSLMTNFKQLFKKKKGYRNYLAHSVSVDTNASNATGSVGSLLNVNFLANDCQDHSHRKGSHSSNIFKKKLGVRFSLSSSRESLANGCGSGLKTLQLKKQSTPPLVRTRKLTAAAIFEIDMKESVI